jgi:hypothetical protein
MCIAHMLLPWWPSRRSLVEETMRGGGVTGDVVAEVFREANA